MFVLLVSKDNHLWRFLLDLLKDNNCNPEHIRWENRAEGIFTIVNSAHVAGLWGKKKKNDKMNYEKMSRAIRFGFIYGDSNNLFLLPKIAAENRLFIFIEGA